MGRFRLLTPFFVVVAVAILCVLAVVVTYYFFFPYSIRLFSTLLALAITFAVRFFLEHGVAKRFLDRRTQFIFRRVVNAFSFIAILVAVLAIWIQDVAILFVSTGIIGAGIAIALQDVFRNMAGGIIVLVNRTYKIGDRIEVDGKYGDVIDIGLFNTTLLEIQEWIDGDQATGRLTTIPNAFVLSKQFNNYNREYAYVWDEISIPITYDSDWQEANEKIKAIVEEYTQETAKKANQALNILGQRYYFTKRNVSSAIYITLTDNWISFKIRYTTEVHNRRTLNSKLSQRILEEIENSNNIHIASTTLSISGHVDVGDKNAERKTG